MWRFGAVVRGRRVLVLSWQAGAWSSKGRKREGKTSAAILPARPEREHPEGEGVVVSLDVPIDATLDFQRLRLRLSVLPFLFFNQGTRGGYRKGSKVAYLL
jgi:hypothetical protein